MKTNHLALFICLFVSSSSFGQSRISVGPSISSNFSYRILKPDSIKSSRWYMTKKDKPSFGITTGLNLQIRINDHSGIQVGAHYSEQGSKVVFTKDDFPNTDLFDQDLVIESMQVYFDVPVLYQYKRALPNSFSWIMKTGASINFFQESYTINTFDGNEKEKRNETDLLGHPEFFKDVTYSYIFGTGASYNLGRFEFMLQAVYRQNFISAFDNGPLKLYHFNIGVESGIFYNL